MNASTTKDLNVCVPAVTHLRLANCLSFQGVYYQLQLLLILIQFAQPLLVGWDYTSNKIVQFNLIVIVIHLGNGGLWEDRRMQFFTLRLYCGNSMVKTISEYH